MKQLIILASSAILLLYFNAARAQDFVYEPINSAFGGNSYNYQWMLNSALAQNTMEDESSLDRAGRDPLTDFQEGLNRKILSQLSRSLVESQFGEGGLTEGTYLLGDYSIDVSETDEGIQVIIIDESTGSQTTVLIPFF
jgi:curli production assembly/transport component CsgF